MRARPARISIRPRLHSIRTYRITHYPNSITRGQTRQAHRETSCHVHEAREQGVALHRWGPYVAGDEDGYDERVDGENTGHDDGDERLDIWSTKAQMDPRMQRYLHDQVGPVCSHACDSNS